MPQKLRKLIVIPGIHVPYIVKFFEPTVSDPYRLNDLKFEVPSEEIVRKVDEPQQISVRKSW